MIQIKDTDLPVTVAQKIITGTFGPESDTHQRDMYDMSDIREIALYLMVFYVMNREKEE